jgi:hypothetical protein
MYDTESDYEEEEEELEIYSEDENEPEQQINSEHNKKVQEFVGTLNSKQGWNKCMYCDRYHPYTMHLPGIEYCGHCWAWLNSNQLDLEKYTYTGQNNITDVKKYLGLTFKLHDPTKCAVKECVYNKINAFKKEKKLHKNFCLELGFEVEPEPETVQMAEQTHTKSQKSQFELNKKSSMRINYKQSYIII